MEHLCHCPSNYNCTVCNGNYQCYRINEKYICKGYYVNYDIIFLLLCIMFTYPTILLIKKIRCNCKKENTENIDEVGHVSIDPEETIHEETGEESPPSYVALYEKT